MLLKRLATMTTAGNCVTLALATLALSSEIISALCNTMLEIATAQRMPTVSKVVFSMVRMMFMIVSFKMSCVNQESQLAAACSALNEVNFSAAFKRLAVTVTAGNSTIATWLL